MAALRPDEIELITRLANAAMPPPSPAATPRLTTPHGAGVTARTTSGRPIVTADGPSPGINHPILAAEAVGCAGSLLHLGQVAPGWVLLSGAAAAGVAGIATWDRFRDKGAAWFAGAAAAGAGAIAGTEAYYGLFSQPGALALAAGAALGGPLYANLRRRHDARYRQEYLARAAERAAAKRHEWESIIEKACKTPPGQITVDLARNDAPWIQGERTFPAGFALALKLGDNAPDLSSFAGATPAIERIASNRLPLNFRPGSIQVRKLEWANELELIVPTKDILRESFPMHAHTTPQDANMPVLCATSVDGTLVGINFTEDPHALIAGMTGYGKSVYLSAHTVNLSAAPNCVVWKICGQKPERLFGQWFKRFLSGEQCPYTESGFVEPVIDWFAADVDETARMLLDAYKAISIRTKMGALDTDKITPTAALPRIVILIDEAPDILDSTRKFKPWDWDGPTVEQDAESSRALGRKMETGWTIADILLKIIRLARSEGINIVLASQRATNSLLGEHGTTIKSQVGLRASLRQQAGYDLTATFCGSVTGIDISSLPPGQMYIELSGMARPAPAKGLDSRSAIAEASYEHCRWARPLDPTTADDLDFYAGRWTRANQQNFLRGLDPNARRTVPGGQRGAGISTTQPVSSGAPTAAIAPPADPPEPPAPSTGDSAGLSLVNAPAAEQIRWMADQMADLANLGDIADLGDLPPDNAGDDTPPVPEIALDPRWPQDSRDLLTALARDGVDLLYGDWIASQDILGVAVAALGWESSSGGSRRVVAALDAAGVGRPQRSRSRGDRRSGYPVSAIKKALGLGD